MRTPLWEGQSSEGESILKFELHPVAKSLWLLLTFGAFALLCEVVYAIEILTPTMLLSLALTRVNWWGVVTSPLVHLSGSHIANDAGSITLLSILMYALANWRKDWKPPVLAMCVLPFASAIGANVVYYVLSPNPMGAGSSGVAYGMMGVALAYSMRGTLQSLTAVDWLGIRSRLVKPKVAIQPVALYLAVFVVMTAQVVWSPSAFLNAEPGVNYGIHGLAFILGLFSMFIYGMVQKLVGGSEE